MKRCASFTILLLITLVSSVWAFSQEPIKIDQQLSLASMPAGEKFTSEKCGFTMALSQKPTESNADEQGIRGVVFTWNVKEGMIAVKCAEHVNGVEFVTDSDREQFLKGYISVFEKMGVKSITETPYAAGAFKGKTYTFLMPEKVQLSLILAGKKSIEIMALANASVPGSDVLLFKAANSFGLLPPRTKQ